MGDRYTLEETVLCAYIARYGEDNFKIEDVHHLNNRSINSINLKIQNIASNYDEEKIERYSKVKSLSGVPNGQIGRRTDWEIIFPLTKLDKDQFIKKCKNILKEEKKRLFLQDVTNRNTDPSVFGMLTPIYFNINTDYFHSDFL